MLPKTTGREHGKKAALQYWHPVDMALLE